MRDEAPASLGRHPVDAPTAAGAYDTAPVSDPEALGFS
jgi:hypothetical protein